MTGAEIAETLAMPLSTVSGILTRIGLGKLWRLEPLEPPNRYEKRRPGELVHIDVKKLGRIGRPGHRVNGDRRTRSRGIGWEYVHVAIDDATRLVYVEVLDDEKAVTAVGFLRRAVAHFAAFGVRVERVMTDNGSAYRAIVHALACKALGIKHLRTRPYRPRTNGKAERFIRTMLAGWAYGAIYRNSDERRARTRRLARFLQSTTTTPQPRPPSPDRAPTDAQPEQPPRVLHLEHGGHLRFPPVGALPTPGVLWVREHGQSPHSRRLSLNRPAARFGLVLALRQPADRRDVSARKRCGCSLRPGL